MYLIIIHNSIYESQDSKWQFNSSEKLPFFIYAIYHWVIIFQQNVDGAT